MNHVSNLFTKSQQEAWDKIHHYNKNLADKIAAMIEVNPTTARNFIDQLTFSSDPIEKIHIPDHIHYAVAAIQRGPIRREAKDTIILVDVDGVLVDWLTPFKEFMAEKQYKETIDMNEHYDLKKKYLSFDGRVEEFNHNEEIIRNLKPIQGAVEVVKKLHYEHRYVFHAITCLSRDPRVQKARGENIRSLFGKTTFDEIICLNSDEDKLPILSKYNDSQCFWLEDHIENAQKGVECGLRTFLFDRPYNQMADNQSFRRVSGWHDFYKQNWVEFRQRD
jgi:uncharacterized HAD superfamily protein